MMYVAVKMETQGEKTGFLRLALPLTVVNQQIQSLRNKIYMNSLHFWWEVPGPETGVLVWRDRKHIMSSTGTETSGVDHPDRK